MGVEEREKLRGILRLAVSQRRLKELKSGEDFLALLSHPKLLGDRRIPDDAARLIKGYVQANLSGGKQLEDFTKQTFGPLSDKFFDSPITAGSELTFADVVALALHAVDKWGVKSNPNEINKLPLAV